MQDTKIKILKNFLEEKGSFVSGEKLSKQLGISRVMINKFMDRLRDEGFIFEAKTKHGYRLISEPRCLHEAWLRAYLEKIQIEIPVLFFNRINSTSSEAEKFVLDGLKCPFAVIAEEQTQGRGRYGRIWQSARGGNIYLSFAFKPDLPISGMQGFTLWMGLCLCDFFNQEGIPLKLKWPNDLLHKGKKVVGILAEARIESDCLHHVILGIGVNVNHNPKEEDKSLKDKATSLSEALGNELSVSYFAANILKSMLFAYEQFLNGSYKILIPDLWQRYDLLHRKKVHAEGINGNVSGIAQGIDFEGNLLVETKGGEIVRVNSGEVSLSKSY